MSFTKSPREILTILIEECSEVIKAITKIFRQDGEIRPYKDLMEEIADVEIMIAIAEEYKLIDRIYINNYKARKRAIRG